MKRDNTYELSRERLVQHAISRSPTKMFENPTVVSPTRRQANSYLDINQPAGDTSSLSMINQDHSNSRASVDLAASRQASMTGGADSYRAYQKPKKKHEDLLGKISDTIRMQDIHNAVLNDRLQKTKSAINTTSNSGYSRPEAARTTAKKSSSTIKHSASYINNRRTEYKASSSAYDPDFFGPSDIQLASGASSTAASKRHPSS